MIQEYGCGLLIQETIQTRTRGGGTESKGVRRHPDPREIIEITFDDSMINQVYNLEENFEIQDDILDEDRKDIIENQETETENDKTQLDE
jgi:hypothetical protein